MKDIGFKGFAKEWRFWPDWPGPLQLSDNPPNKKNKILTLLPAFFFCHLPGGEFVNYQRIF